MANDLNNTNDDAMPPFTDHLKTVTEDLKHATTDLTWLSSYDLDMIDAIETFTEYEVCKQALADGDSIELGDDLLIRAQGVGRAVADVLAVERTTAGEESLFVLLYWVAQLGYANGVRDVSEGSLSERYARRIAKERANADNRRRVMREFYDDIRDNGTVG